MTSEIPTPPPTLPRRGPLLLAFLGVVLAGTFGAFIGYGLADLSSTTHATTTNLLGALIGAVICAGGVGVVAVLTLRAMAEWQQHPADRLSAPTAEPDAPSPRG